jgi:hypothetical protein
VDEVSVSVKHGCLLLRIHGFYEYEVKQYSLNTGDVEHFTQYIDTSLKLKTEDIGYAGWVRWPRDEESYVQYFREIDNIELDKTAIQKNAAKKALAEFYLNLFLGKMTKLNK